MKIKIYLYKDIINSILSFVEKEYRYTFFSPKKRDYKENAKYITKCSSFLDEIKWSYFDRGFCDRAEYGNIFINSNKHIPFREHVKISYFDNVPDWVEDVLHISGKYNIEILHKISSETFCVIEIKEDIH